MLENKTNGFTGTIFRPLFFEFPDDNLTYDLSFQFLLGQDLMGAPVVIPGNDLTNKTTILIYFPKTSNWFDWFTGARYTEGTSTHTVQYNETIPLFLRQGKIVHVQENFGVTRARQLNNTFKLKVGLFDNGGGTYQALGTMLTIKDYDDQSVYDHCVNQNCVMTFTLSAYADAQSRLLNATINCEPKSNITVFDEVIINSIDFYGIHDGDNYVNAHYIFDDPWVITGSVRGEKISVGY